MDIRYLDESGDSSTPNAFDDPKQAAPITAGLSVDARMVPSLNSDSSALERLSSSKGYANARDVDALWHEDTGSDPITKVGRRQGTSAPAHRRALSFLDGVLDLSAKHSVKWVGRAWTREVQVPLLFFPRLDIGPAWSPAMLGNHWALTLDFVARQKIGGTPWNDIDMKQSAALPPADLAFILLRVFGLSCTAHHGPASRSNLAACDSRRTPACADRETCCARLDGFHRDEPRCILDPRNVMDAHCPDETLRALTDGEIRPCTRYRTPRSVSGAWHRLSALPAACTPDESRKGHPA